MSDFPSIALLSLSHAQMLKATLTEMFKRRMSVLIPRS
jgi:hypothetical protein